MPKTKTVFVSKKVEVPEETINIVDFLAGGSSIKDISTTTGVNARTLEAKIAIIKNEFDAKSLSHLVAIFFRNKLIK